MVVNKSEDRTVRNGENRNSRGAVASTRSAPPREHRQPVRPGRNSDMSFRDAVASTPLAPHTSGQPVKRARVGSTPERDGYY